MDMDMLDKDDKICHLEVMKILAKATYHFGQYGVEINLYFMKKHGSQSCSD